MKVQIVCVRSLPYVLGMPEMKMLTGGVLLMSCAFVNRCRIPRGYLQSDLKEGEGMNAVKGMLLGAGEATEMQQDASEAMATRQGTHGAAQAQIRALIALGILEAVEACTRASEIVERLDGTYIYDDDWG